MYNLNDFITNSEFDKLYEKAMVGYNNAYVPYSNFHVGASLLCNDGVIFYGCNVENSSYGLSNCAERTTLFKAISEGYHKKEFKALLIVGDTVDAISPCGACRQVMEELLGLETLVILTNLNKKVRLFKVKDLLPYSFGGDNLNEQKL